MRVITGSARGRRLRELEGMETRPTTDRVKEGMVSILQFDIEGRRVLDLFAGTGQLGIECLSRGAAEVTFVDRRGDAVRLIRENLRVTNLDNMNTVIVCVTDRGPHRRKRIIDVSSSAAEILGFKKKGIARVRIEEVPGPIDLRWLELIYPKPAPYLQPKEQPAAPYHMKIKP